MVRSEKVEDLSRRKGGEEQAAGAVEVGGEEREVRVGFGSGGEAQGDGHDFGFAEEEAGERAGGLC